MHTDPITDYTMKLWQKIVIGIEDPQPNTLYQLDVSFHDLIDARFLE